MSDSAGTSGAAPSPTAHPLTRSPTMHITNLQFIIALFLLSNVFSFLIGRRHGRRS